MHLILKIVCWLVVFSTTHDVLFGQEGNEEKLPVNQSDEKGKKHGMWYFSTTARMGEPGTIEFGSYQHGKRVGKWYKMEKETSDLLSIESYKNGMLHGEVKYFEMGKLYCTGNYLALDPQKKYDTIVVTDPETLLESYRILSTESGSIRHGIWQYFDPQTGHMIRTEDYVGDELVFRKDFEASGKDGDGTQQHYQKNMPHNKKQNYQPPPGKRSYTQ